MRSYDRDFYVSTISVMQNQRRHIIMLLDDMDMRLEELHEALVIQAEVDDEVSMEELLDGARDEGFMARMILEDDGFENDIIMYDSSRKPKLCTCDDCWSDDPGNPGYRMD